MIINEQKEVIDAASEVANLTKQGERIRVDAPFAQPLMVGDHWDESKGTVVFDSPRRVLLAQKKAKEAEMKTSILEKLTKLGLTEEEVNYFIR
jgi:hypothetical protein